MGVDPPPDDVMSTAAAGCTDRIIDREMQLGVVLVGVVMALATLLAIDLSLPGGLIEGRRHRRGPHDGLHHAGPRPAVQLLQRPLRTARAPSTTCSPTRCCGPRSALSLLLQVAVVHLPLLNHAFDTTPLSASDWLICAVLASSVLWAEELRKLVRRAWARR